MAKKAPKAVLMITGDAGETYEVLYGKHRLEEEGYRAVIAAPSKKTLNLVIHDFAPGWDTYIERQGYGVSSDIALPKAKAGDYAAVLIPGGRAPEYLRHDTDAVRLVKEFSQQGKPIFAVCHGVQILVAAGLVRGKKLTCYTHVRSEAESAGATWVNRESVRDGLLVTAQTWLSHPDFYRDIFTVLKGL